MRMVPIVTESMRSQFRDFKMYEKKGDPNTKIKARKMNTHQAVMTFGDGLKETVCICEPGDYLLYSVPLNLLGVISAEDLSSKFVEVYDSEKLALCAGCSNEIYLSTKRGCWEFEQAVIVRKKHVGKDDTPPFMQVPQDTMSCFRKSGIFLVNPGETS
jgi:hypothetical protein